MDKHRTYTSVKLNKVLKERAPTLEIMVVLVQCGQVADPLHARLLPSWLAGWLAGWPASPTTPSQQSHSSPEVPSNTLGMEALFTKPIRNGTQKSVGTSLSRSVGWSGEQSKNPFCWEQT